MNHGTSHGLKATPRFYRCHEVGAPPVDVTQIQFSPFKQHLFLVRALICSFSGGLVEWKSESYLRFTKCLLYIYNTPTLLAVEKQDGWFCIWELENKDPSF